MNEECHALLKGVCALKGVTVSEYVYNVIAEEFYRLVREDNQVQSMFLAGTYKEGGNAYRLKELLKEELNSTNDSPA
jgi:truncated hemoglobin YjbI